MTQVGKYNILEQIGEGAMGVVYRAMDPILNRPVAIKVMNDGLAQDDALRERFLREAQAAGSLQHPNVVTIYDFGETDGHLFIAMEYIQGADLEHLLRHHAPLSLAAKLDIMIDVLNGLSYAHRRGIIHRDIKPANIRVDEDGHARIMDFGVARLSTSNLTSTGVMMGTPNYMAPEQISGEQVTSSVDLFSAGAVLYELLTNAKPFSGDTLHSVLFKIVSDVPVEIRELNPELPPALNDVVNRALAKSPSERYRNAAEMANALQAVRAPLGPARLSKTVSQRVSIEKGLQAQREKALREQRDRYMKVGGSVVVALLVIAIGAFALMRPRTARAPGGSSAGAVAAPVAASPAPQPAPPPTVDTSRRVVADTAAARVVDGQTRPASPASALRAATTARVPANSPASVPARDTARRARPTEPTATRVAEKAASEPTATVQGSTTQAAPAPAQVLPVNPPPVSPSVTQTPVITPPVASVKPSGPTLESSRASISTVVAAYARSIGTRDVAEVRRAYPGLTAQQQSGWESFFGSVRSIIASFDIASLDVNGSSASAQLRGSYEYVTRAGRTERQPVTLQATFELDGDRWRLQAVR